MNVHGARLAVALTCLTAGFAAGAWWSDIRRATPPVSEAPGDVPRVAALAQAPRPSSMPASLAPLPSAADSPAPVAPGVGAPDVGDGGDGQVVAQLAAAQAAEGLQQAPADVTGPIDQQTAQSAGGTPSEVVAAPPSRTGGGLDQLAAQQGDGS